MKTNRHWPYYVVATVLTIAGVKLFVHSINVKAERVLCFSDWISEASTLDNEPDEIIAGCARRHPFLKFR